MKERIRREVKGVLKLRKGREIIKGEEREILEAKGKGWRGTKGEYTLIKGEKKGFWKVRKGRVGNKGRRYRD